ncbi:MAG: type II toxin-antitoxin system Phd/YefM family antitoxin [Ruminococcus sp.]|nr:type II toxin-antitoxin system Phd/YefM family antitoxin [Ruminococcus sp.]
MPIVAITCDNERSKFVPTSMDLEIKLSVAVAKAVIPTVALAKEYETMLALNYSTIRSKFKDYCDKATTENETVIVTRKNEKNVVLMSLEQYNSITKALRNAEYLAKIDRAIQQLEQGEGQQHELIEESLNE